MNGQLADLAHGTHVCGMFGCEQERDAAVVSFVDAGLAAGDRVWCLTETRAPDTLLGELRDAGVDAGRAVAAGQLAVLSADQSYLRELPFDPRRRTASLHHAVDDALRDGYAGFRVVGDMAWATRDVPGAQRLFEYERVVSDVFETRPAAALCLYDAHRFSTDALGRAASAHHSRLVADFGFRTRSGASGSELCIDGEVDVSNVHALAGALCAAAGGHGDVHLELAGLHFIDVGGTRELVAFAGRLGQDRRLVLHHPPDVLRRTLDLAWPDPGPILIGTP